MPKGFQGRPSKYSDEPHENCKKFNISMPAQLYMRLNEYAEKEERTKSWIIKKAVEEFLAKEGN